MVTLRLGCVKERAALRPSRQVWHESALPWVQEHELLVADARSQDGPPHST
jgi:hypothetical protein